jgi:hypothetical protein
MPSRLTKPDMHSAGSVENVRGISSPKLNIVKTTVSEPSRSVPLNVSQLCVSIVSQLMFDDEQMNATEDMHWLDSPLALDGAVERLKTAQSVGLDVGMDFHGRGQCQSCST